MPGDENPLRIALEFGEALDALGIGYFLGGSLASSMQGEPRATNDIDLVLDLRPDQVGPLSARLGPDFDVDEEALEESARRGASWNVFHVPTATRLDIFIKGRAPFDESEFARRASVEIESGRFLSVKSPEDTVLRKLIWFQRGNETSQAQWRDVVQVLRASGDSMDADYLRGWAAQLSLGDLLDRATREAAE